MTPRTLIPVARTVVLLVALLASGLASADISKSVINAFRGQLVITKGELPEGKNDKDTIQQIKKAKVSELTGEANDEVMSWSFQYTAFLKKTGASTLKLEFYQDGKRFVADKTLSGVDPKSAVLSGEISITEDEGLTRGKPYVIKLVAGKNTVVATANLTMK